MFDFTEEEFNANINIGFIQINGRIRNAIRKMFNWYCHIQNIEYNLPYDDGHIESMRIDSNWIKVQGLIITGVHRYNLPQPQRNEMNIPSSWIFRENWKELIEQQILRDKNEYLIKKLSE